MEATELRTAAEQAARREALQVLRIVAPVVSICLALEGLSHIIETPESTHLIAFPFVASVVLAAIGLWAVRQSEPIASAWLLIPWGFVFASNVQHVYGGAPTGAVLFMCVGLLGLAALVLSPGPLLVAGFISVLGITWASYVAFDRLFWVYPAIVVPMAGVVSWSRRRAVFEAEHRRIVEERLAIERARLESLRRTQTLAAGLAHHFNNLLAVIVGNTELLAEDGAPNQGDELSDIIAAGRQAALIVEDILAYSGHAPLHERVQLNAAALLDQTLVRVEPVARVVVTRTQPLPAITCELEPLTKALAHIVQNALDATSEAAVQVAMQATTSRLIVEVSDQGPGVPEAAQPHVFDPFFTTRGPKRTGLGLAFAKGVIEGHGGTIALTSQEGRGTQVRVVLPLTYKRPKAAPATPASR
ncbi:MAG: HAMP domain-containing sensor histidine kinase [Myxococcota bacterium]